MTTKLKDGQRYIASDVRIGDLLFHECVVNNVDTQFMMLVIGLRKIPKDRDYMSGIMVTYVDLKNHKKGETGPTFEGNIITCGLFGVIRDGTFSNVIGYS